MTDNLVKILDGNTFVVSDPRGDIDATPSDPAGFFSWDTRHLSKWALSVDGHRLNPLSVDDVHYFEARFFLVPGTGPCTWTPSCPCSGSGRCAAASPRSCACSTTTTSPWN